MGTRKQRMCIPYKNIIILFCIYSIFLLFCILFFTFHVPIFCYFFILESGILKLFLCSLKLLFWHKKKEKKLTRHVKYRCRSRNFWFGGGGDGPNFGLERTVELFCRNYLSPTPPTTSRGCKLYNSFTLTMFRILDVKDAPSEHIHLLCLVTKIERRIDHRRVPKTLAFPFHLLISIISGCLLQTPDIINSNFFRFPWKFRV